MERQARRAQVLRHAKRIFARKGYHRTNVADIIARARIARGTFYLYFQNKKDLFEELLAQVLRELSRRIQRLRGRMSPTRSINCATTCERVINFVLTERELTDILLNHSVGFDRELGFADPANFTSASPTPIQRSLDLGVQMNLVRTCDTRVAAYCILGGIKEVVGADCRGGARARSRRWSRRFWTSDCAEWRARSCSKKPRRRGELQAGEARYF